MRSSSSHTDALAIREGRVDVAFVAQAYGAILAMPDDERTSAVEALARVIDQTDDFMAVGAIATAHVIEENVVAPIRWVRELFENSIERRFRARRAERGGDGKIAIPHPTIDVENVVDFGPYYVDVDLLEQAVRDLPDDERAKLLIVTPEHVEPEHIVPARTVPRSVQPGSIASIKAARDKYPGTPTGAALAACIKRTRMGDRTTIRPKKATLPRRGAL